MPSKWLHTLSKPLIHALTVVVVVVVQTLQYELCTSVTDSPQTNPIIGRIARKAGHGCGQPTQKMVTSTPQYSVDCPVARIKSQDSLLSFHLETLRFGEFEHTNNIIEGYNDLHTAYQIAQDALH